MTSTGLESLAQEQGAVQQRIQNWSDSILAMVLTKGAGFAESAGLSWLGGKMGINQTTVPQVKA